MTDLAEEVNKYLRPGKRQRLLEFEFAGETYGCDPSISELLVPMVVINVPRGLIRKYNLATTNKNSEALPDADKFWEFLNPHLVGKGLAAEKEYEGEMSVDDAIRELLEWPHYAIFKKSYNARRQEFKLLLEVKAMYDPCWEDEE